MGTEICDDNDFGACSDDCSEFKIGFECTYEETRFPRLQCFPVCKDNLIIHPEVCDVGSDTGSICCKNDCSGVLYGWYATFDDLNLVVTECET